jgi:hypothetical protein
MFQCIRYKVQQVKIESAKELRFINLYHIKSTQEEIHVRFAKRSIIGNNLVYS